MTALPSLIAALEADRSLLELHALHARSQALDRLERALDFAGSDAVQRQRAEAMRARLEALDRALCEALRADTAAGGSGLRDWIERDHGDGDGDVHGEHYDHLDELVSGVLRLPAPGEDIAALGEEMVFYQPTPARHAFDALRRLRLSGDDVLIDLGAGLGHVPLLAAACTPARAHGVEIEPAYVASAQACAAELRLTRATFACADARAVDFDAGTVFYLYTPFTGTILRQVLDALARQARQRTIRLCTLGPCTATVAAEPWLDGDGPLRHDRVAVFSSR
ncbi:hypothetical protein LVB77_08580 [Lysobacter sp. 5GHs7-4]|uniref:methyltransferase domain-containing protein n=1 Tax=Lysobacter sp. 5GHs7-4 TaxID=2904253 RepID=UPI001E4FA723|nr:methyltransferase domain-containing protein [Lysobacter sp. 5GHs7-4]UHQ24726.1 hypothetical protein LVB77_08580 [Lysobacter sp. 5GHs7-4]